MNNISADLFKPLLTLYERVLGQRNLTLSQRQDEFDKFFNCIIQGKDISNTFERRSCGIADDEWDVAKNNFFKSLGMIE